MLTCAAGRQQRRSCFVDCGNASISVLLMVKGKFKKSPVRYSNGHYSRASYSKEQFINSGEVEAIPAVEDRHYGELSSAGRAVAQVLGTWAAWTGMRCTSLLCRVQRETSRSCYPSTSSTSGLRCIPQPPAKVPSHQALRQALTPSTDGHASATCQPACKPCWPYECPTRAAPSLCPCPCRCRCTSGRIFAARR